MARSSAPIWTMADTRNWAGYCTVPRTGAGTWTSAREGAGAGAEAVPGTQYGAVVAVTELWARNRALARAVYLIVVPASSWRWGSFGGGKGPMCWKALGGIVFIPGRFCPGATQPFIQLPLGRRGVINLRRGQRDNYTISCQFTHSTIDGPRLRTGHASTHSLNTHQPSPHSNANI